MHTNSGLCRVGGTALVGLAALMGTAPPAAPAEIGSAARSAPQPRVLYVSNGVTADIATFAIGRDGRPAPIDSPVPTDAIPRGIVFSLDGTRAYVVNTGANDVTVYAVAADGKLTRFGAAAATGAFPFGIAMSPDGKAVYTSNSNDDSVSAFAVNDDGTLTRLGDDVPTVDDFPRGVAVSPDGRHLYVSNFGSSDITAFDIDVSGALREIDGSPFPTGSSRPLYQSAAIRPNQGPVASFSATARAAGRPTRFDASAAADADGAVARHYWDFGDGTVRPNGGATPAHVYRRPGIYRVTLVVTDNEGCSTRRIFTGQSALCDGSAAARATQTVVVE